MPEQLLFWDKGSRATAQAASLRRRRPIWFWVLAALLAMPASVALLLAILAGLCCMPLLLWLLDSEQGWE